MARQRRGATLRRPRSPMRDRRKKRALPAIRRKLLLCRIAGALSPGFGRRGGSGRIPPAAAESGAVRPGARSACALSCWLRPMAEPSTSSVLRKLADAGNNATPMWSRHSSPSRTTFWTSSFDEKVREAAGSLCQTEREANQPRLVRRAQLHGGGVASRYSGGDGEEPHPLGTGAAPHGSARGRIDRSMIDASRWVRPTLTVCARPLRAAVVEASVSDRRRRASHISLAIDWMPGHWVSKSG